MTKSLIALALGLSLVSAGFAADGAAPAKEETPKAVTEAAAKAGTVKSVAKQADGTFKVTVEKDGKTSELHLDAAGKEVKAEGGEKK